jgi:hypothetical protein
MGPAAYFSRDYAEARAKFLAVAETAGARLSAYVNPQRGPAGEELATDVARFGPADAGRVLLVNSGTHGAEGFCGSGCQTGMMALGLHRHLPADTALVFSHAINPYGFAWLRRVNEDGVDLNRNFIDHARPPANKAYSALHPLLVPTDIDGPARAAADGEITAFIGQKGMRAFQEAVSTGQYDHADGLFYGGRAPVWSNLTFREIVRRHLGHASRIAFIDLHTGLGPSGYGEPIHIGWDLATSRAWFGDKVTSMESGESASANVGGSIERALHDQFPQPAGAMIALEFGTRPISEVLDALRADNWLHKHGDLASPQGRAIKQRLRDTFFVDTPDWKQAVLDQTCEKVRAALRNLAGETGKAAAG